MVASRADAVPRLSSTTLACITTTAPNAALRRRIELLIRVLAPALDLMLAVGDRLSSTFDREQPGSPPARMQREGESAPRGLTGRQ
jgi:hypothetical protein